MAYKYISSMPGIKAEADVSYSFICEHCERHSGVVTKTFQDFMADPSQIKGSQPLPPEYFASMSVLAKEKLKNQIDKLKNQIKYGEYRDAKVSLFSDNVNAECPYCGMYQSWMSKGLWKSLYLYPFIFGIAALMTFTFYCMFKYGLNKIQKVEGFLFVLTTLIGVSIGLIVGIIDVIITKKRTGKVKSKRLPIINFPDPEYARTAIATIHINEQGECTYAS